MAESRPSGAAVIGPASLRILIMQLFVLNIHITLFHFIFIFHTQNTEVILQSHSLNGRLTLGWSGR